MNKKRILYYLKTVTTIIVSAIPSVAAVWWILDKYGNQINWQPLLNVITWVGIIVVCTCGLYVTCVCVKTLYDEIKADLYDRELKKDGKTLCRKCLGRGCRNCDQNGYLDWVSRVVGVKEKYIDNDTPQQQAPSGFKPSGKTL